MFYVSPADCATLKVVEQERNKNENERNRRTR